MYSLGPQSVFAINFLNQYEIKNDTIVEQHSDYVSHHKEHKQNLKASTSEYEGDHKQEVYSKKSSQSEGVEEVVIKSWNFPCGCLEC